MEKLRALAPCAASFLPPRCANFSVVLGGSALTRRKPRTGARCPYDARLLLINFLKRHLAAGQAAVDAEKDFTLEKTGQVGRKHSAIAARRA
jgi:hypothetical protein